MNVQPALKFIIKTAKVAAPVIIDYVGKEIKDKIKNGGNKSNDTSNKKESN